MPHAILVSASRIASDPRVTRQGEALAADGWSVTSIGYTAPPLPEPAWQARHVPEPGYETDLARRLVRIASLMGCRILPSLAEGIWASQARHAALVSASEGLSADLVVANDYTSLPVAANIAGRSGAGLMYDSHEDAAGERPTDRNWRLLYPPYIRAIERRFAPMADVVTTVSEGIAASLQSTYTLPKRPAVIRNLPRWRPVPDIPRTGTILVHHHGILVPGRGLEIMIDSLPSWRPEFSLRLRGPITPSYKAELEARARTLGAFGRLAFADPVPFDDLVVAAADADVGLHILPVFAMPNKVFEYVMAGLSLITCDLPELTGIVREHDLGQVLPEVTPQALATAVNRLNRSTLPRQRERALAASRVLCWDHEKLRFLALCRECLAAARERAA